MRDTNIKAPRGYANKLAPDETCRHDHIEAKTDDHRWYCRACGEVRPAREGGVFPRFDDCAHHVVCKGTWPHDWACIFCGENRTMIAHHREPLPTEGAVVAPRTT